jgi:hypothetical protein
LERILAAERREEAFIRPEGFDVLEETLRALGDAPRTWPAVVDLGISVEAARRVIPAETAQLEATETGARLRCSTYDLSWLAR